MSGKGEAAPRRRILGIMCVIVALCVAAAVLLWKLGRFPGEDDRFVIPEHIVICLDAGHGGGDAGAVSGERLEKDDNLAMALAVCDALNAFGPERVTVLLTREDDSGLELQQRVDIANGANATLFVSFHRNSGGGQGTEVWISAAGKRAETRLASLILEGLTDVGVSRDRGVRRGTAGDPNVSYTVVGRTSMPACLIELGFIDSEADNALLDEHFDAYAAAIADGILKMVELK